MPGKYFMVDTTKCTACRGCQILYKQWNKLPATETQNWGSHQNPKDLSFETYRVVRFNEYDSEKNSVAWCTFSPTPAATAWPRPARTSLTSTSKDAIVVDDKKK